MKIQTVPITQIKPYEKNPRKNEQAVDKVAESIRMYGFNQPIVVDKDYIIVVGHTRYKAAQKLGLIDVPTLIIDDLSPEKLRAYRIADNKLNELAVWDDTLLLNELQELQNLGTDLEQLGFSKSELQDILGTDESENTYTKKIDTPVYEPRGEKPDIKVLYDTSKSAQLIKKIKAANLTEQEREFLLAAAYRHNVFNYQEIAEYYCHSSKEVQELFEESALVIIDFDKAISNGYVELVNELKQLYLQTYGSEEGVEENVGQ